VLVTTLVVLLLFSNDSAPATATAATTAPAPTPTTKFLRDTLLAFLESSCPSAVMLPVIPSYLNPSFKYSVIIATSFNVAQQSPH
jgi:hypothetical protein